MKWMIEKKYHGRMDEMDEIKALGAKLGEIEASGAKWSKIGRN